MNGEGDSGAEKEIAREVEHMNMVSGEKRKLFLSGEIEGGIKVTPLHSLCSVQIQSGEDRVEVSIGDSISGLVLTHLYYCSSHD